jgi:hypothetical protein
MNLDSTTRMQTPFCREICGMGQLGRRKVPEVFFGAGMPDLRREITTSAVLGHTQQPRCVVFARAFLILCVEAVCRFAQVGYSVVTAITVDVVDKTLWPHAVYIQPCKTMGAICGRTDTNVSIAFFCAARYTSGGSVGAASRAPREDTGLRVVVQKRTYAFRSQWDNLFAHAACPPDKGLGSYPRGCQALGVAPLYAGVA